MATNREQEGIVIDFTNAGSAILSGAVVIIGDIIGVALVNIATSATGAVAITEVYDIPKVDAAVIAQGESVNFDLSALAIDDKNATPASGDIVDCGIAFETLGATTNENIKILLTPGTGSVTP